MGAVDRGPRLGGCFINGDELADKAVALRCHGLNEARFFGVVAQNLADFADGSVDAVLGIDKDFAAPEMLGDFGSSNEIAVAGCQKNEQFHRLSFEPQVASGTGEFETASVQPKVAELEDGHGHGKGTP